MRQRSAAPAKDYSGYFLVAILLGIVVIILGLTMAAAQSSSRLQQMDRSVVTGARDRAAVKFTMNDDRYIFRRMEPIHGG